MSPIVKELRNAAKCVPLWKNIFEAAADEIERLQRRVIVTQDRLDRANAVISQSAIDEMSNKQEKANAVMESIEYKGFYILKESMMQIRSMRKGTIPDHVREKAIEALSKLEQGKV